MRFISVGRQVVLALAAVVALGAVGCGKDEERKSAAATDSKEKQSKEADKKALGTDKKADDHSGWWCSEHGIPEHLCSMCDEKIAAACKKNDDWCQEHDRAKSQCFKCEPKLKEKFAAMYRNKYGKEPPPVEEK